MTSDITPITAASNGGSDSSTKDKPASPERGFTRLQETQVYHLTALVQAALYEAEHMVRQAHDQARDRWLDHGNTTEPLNADELSRLLSDAYQCATLASSYTGYCPVRSKSPCSAGTSPATLRPSLMPPR